MNTRQAVVQQIEDLGVVAVIRLKEPEKLRAVVDAIAAGGVRALEVTMTVPGAVDLIRALAPTLPPGFLLGAGTVLDAGTAEAVIDAGATFPEHQHPHEQIVSMIEGELELVVDGVAHRLTPGQVFVIPPDARHSGRALTACRVLDAFAPVRDDYR